MGTESHFARVIRQLFLDARPRRVIETGTYHGTGTTAVIAAALKDAQVENAVFHSIEINPEHCRRARANLAQRGYAVNVINGLSVPRRLLPTPQQIVEQCVHHVQADGLFVDHEESDRARLYHRETDFPDVPDDVLGACLREFDHRPDFVLLDSGGHMGYVEFSYLVPRLRGPCFVALDDIYHVKHHRSFRQLQTDRRFELVVASEEKFGFCIARFTPTPK